MEDETVQFLKSLKFKKKLFFGIDEYDVWRKIKELNEKYAQAQQVQKLRFETLASAQAEEILRLRTILKENDIPYV